MTDSAELRVELPREELAVIDGYCSGTNQDRSKVVRQILREWSEAKHREAVCVNRCAGGNPTPAEGGRK